MKRSLANLTRQNIERLTALVKTRLRRIQFRPGLLDGFLNTPLLKIVRRTLTTRSSSPEGST